MTSKIIKCIDAMATEFRDSDLTDGANYVVLAETEYRYQIEDDTKEVFWHHRDRFEVVSP